MKTEEKIGFIKQVIIDYSQAQYGEIPESEMNRINNFIKHCPLYLLESLPDAEQRLLQPAEGEMVYGKAVCYNCEGTGKIDPYNTGAYTCPLCHGTGSYGTIAVPPTDSERPAEQPKDIPGFEGTIEQLNNLVPANAKTAVEILDEYGCPEIPFNEQVTMPHEAIINAMEEYAKLYASRVERVWPGERDLLIEFCYWLNANIFNDIKEHLDEEEVDLFLNDEERVDASESPAPRKQ